MRCWDAMDQTGLSLLYTRLGDIDPSFDREPSWAAGAVHYRGVLTNKRAYICHSKKVAT